MLDSINFMGANILVIDSASARSGGVRGGFGGRPTLTLGDVAAIRELSASLRVSPVSSAFGQLVYGPNNWNCQGLGVNSDYLELRDWKAARGRSFRESDLSGAMRVALVGQQVVENLFGGRPGRAGDAHPQSALHRDRRAGKEGAKHGWPRSGRYCDRAHHYCAAAVVWQPFSGCGGHDHGAAESAARLVVLEQEINALLRQRYRIRAGAEDDFVVTNMSAIAQTASELTGTLSLLLAAIASISLCVGGIGIMNIMLVSVIITVSGGVIGILLGVGLAEAMARFTAVAVEVTFWPILLAFGLSLLGCSLGSIRRRRRRGSSP